MTDDFYVRQFEDSLNRIWADHDTAVKFWAAHDAELKKLEAKPYADVRLIDGVLCGFTIKWANENVPRAEPVDA
jgi:hypothetical protein